MRQDVYRVAYDEANAELLEIRQRFEQLRARKERLEGVVAALGTVFGLSASGSAPAPAEMAPLPPGLKAEQGAESGAYTFDKVPVPLPDLDETGGDPFKRRVRNALRTAV